MNDLFPWVTEDDLVNKGDPAIGCGDVDDDAEITYNGFPDIDQPEVDDRNIVEKGEPTNNSHSSPPTADDEDDWDESDDDWDDDDFDD